jgi:polyisoprenoid-binding protein YceI
VINRVGRGLIGSLALAATLAAQPRDIDPAHSSVTLRVFKSGLFSAFADDHVIRAPIAQGTLDASARSVEIVIDPRQLQVLDPNQSPDSRNDVRKRMLGPEVLDAGRFPEIRFRSTVVKAVGADRWTVEGDLTLHGQTHTVSATVQSKEGRYLGESAVRQRDFGIRPISLAGGTVKVRDEVKIEFDIR